MHYTIVGAGITGLSVAEDLLKHGHSVTLLERYPNVGGRIVTHRDPQYEIGAGRIHKNHKRVHSLITRFKLHTYPIQDDVVYRSLESKINEPTGHEWIFPAILKMLDTVSPKTLASHTLVVFPIYTLSRNPHSRLHAHFCVTRVPMYLHDLL